MGATRSARRIRAVGGGLALALALSSCGGDDDSTTVAPEGDCQAVDAPATKEAKATPPKADAPTARGIVFDTSCGSFTVTFDDRAPKTDASFQSLAEQGFFDGTVFHRVVGDRLIQGGDPLGSDPALAGTGGPGYSVDEKPPPGLSYTEGTVMAAKTTAEPPGRSGSQFLVVVAPDLGLTPDYALVGKVTSGFDVVKAISELAAAGEDGPPTMPVVINKATVEG